MKPAFVFEALNWASSFLIDKKREPRAADLMMRHLLGLSWTDFYLARRDPLAEEVWTLFERAIIEHGEGRPIQHIIGAEEFFGRRFDVHEGVLIPRQETEELVHGVLQWMNKRVRRRARIADIGTGSGAIAITLALEAPGSHVTAVDVEKEALRTAASNAEKLGAAVTMLHGNLTKPLLQTETRYDVIVSNPPYIPEKDWQTLDTLVKDHEPKRALVGGNDDGLACYRQMAEDLPELLKKKGLAAFEVGAGQGKDVAAILAEHLSGAAIEVKLDINGKDRMVFCERGW
ncbi:peptide chain release factor N(5)-glutamine methyltransferase [Alteribacillus sp. HJP-4]|uniref:peptide chain release factor N(5)-glutamine methyltransferase n=1 Tax=Alteribacillus sp. HJP-4 TaxID=2775394 RepID=UPI0035CD3A4D